MSKAYFPRAEYEQRWSRVWSEIKARGYETLIVWQRSAGGYDRVGDIYWLTNFTTKGSGQDAADPEFCAGWSFSAVVFRKDREPDLHSGQPDREIDRDRIICGELFVHAESLIHGLAAVLRDQGVEGRVAVVGDDVLPGMYDRILREQTRQIEWVAEEDLLLEPQMIKSPRELEAFRVGGDMASRALTGAMEAMISGKSGAEAAAVCAHEILRGGGGFHRLDMTHGPETERFLLSSTFYGYDCTTPNPGDMVRGWVYGPIFQGYWLDPGRTAICGSKPDPQRRRLIEAAADAVDAMIAAVRPGVTSRQLGLIGQALVRARGYDEPDPHLPLMGHGVGTYFVPPLIPYGDLAEADPDNKFRYDEPWREGMVASAEIFVTDKGVGTAGFEQNFIVGANGVELLTTTPMLFW